MLVYTTDDIGVFEGKTPDFKLSTSSSNLNYFFETMKITRNYSGVRKNLEHHSKNADKFEFAKLP